MKRPGLLLFLLTLLLLLSTVAGCAEAPSVSDPGPESTGLPKIIVYTDFECGACAVFSSEVEPELRERYVATGKAQIEIRLLGMNQYQMRAAQAALCAGDQGRFLEYKDALFSAYRGSGEDLEVFSIDQLVALAKSLGLDPAAFKKCLESGVKKAEVEKNYDLARADDIRTLPTVVVGTERVEGNKPLAVYVETIDSALKEG